MYCQHNSTLHAWQYKFYARVQYELPYFLYCHYCWYIGNLYCSLQDYIVCKEQTAWCKVNSFLSIYTYGICIGNLADLHTFCIIAFPDSWLRYFFYRRNQDGASLSSSPARIKWCDPTWCLTVPWPLTRLLPRKNNVLPPAVEQIWLRSRIPPEGGGGRRGRRWRMKRKNDMFFLTRTETLHCLKGLIKFRSRQWWASYFSKVTALLYFRFW